jgi:hypothetical protein
MLVLATAFSRFVQLLIILKGTGELNVVFMYYNLNIRLEDFVKDQWNYTQNTISAMPCS